MKTREKIYRTGKSRFRLTTESIRLDYSRKNLRFPRLRRAATVALLVSPILVACGDASEDAAGSNTSDPLYNEEIADSLPDEIQSKGAIKTGTFGNFPPGQFVEEGSSELVGWNVDLADAIGHVLGVDIELEVTTFDALIPALQAGRYEMAMAEANITPERLEAVDFVSYFENSVALAVHTSSDIRAKAPSDLCGRTVGVNRGSSPIPGLEKASTECVDTDEEPITIKTYRDLSEAMLALASERIEVVTGDYAAVAYAASQQENLRLSAQEGYDEVTAGITFPKGSELIPPIEAAMNELIDSGEYEKILEKWNVSAGAVGRAEVNPPPEG